MKTLLVVIETISWRRQKSCVNQSQLLRLLAPFLHDFIFYSFLNSKWGIIMIILRPHLLNIQQTF